MTACFSVPTLYGNNGACATVLLSFLILLCRGTNSLPKPWKSRCRATAGGADLCGDGNPRRTGGTPRMWRRQFDGRSGHRRPIPGSGAGPQCRTRRLGSIHIESQGLYGRVSIQQLRGTRLPYIDNLVNLIVVEQDEGISHEELLRVLCPGGMAYVQRDGKWLTTQSHGREHRRVDTLFTQRVQQCRRAIDVVGPPRRLQWMDGPRYSRHHDRMSSVARSCLLGGGVFSIEDEQSAISILLPARWMLTARDAFNGTVLWKRPIERWFTQFWPLKSGPAQLPRRLIAQGDRVYVTLGFDGPMVALDAATGETVRTYEGTEGTEEAIFCDGGALPVGQPATGRGRVCSSRAVPESVWSALLGRTTTHFDGPGCRERPAALEPGTGCSAGDTGGK